MRKGLISTLLEAYTKGAFTNLGDVKKELAKYNINVTEEFLENRLSKIDTNE